MRIIITESQFKQLKDSCRIGFFDENNGYAHIDENLEAEVEADEVDLSSFEPKTRLAQQLWKNGILDSQVRLHLLDIADDFVEFLGVDWAEPKDIRLTGSICNFNWSNYSDIDIHIVYDFKDIDDRITLVQDFFNTKKNEWNDMHSGLNIYGFDVELYVEDIAEGAVSSGIYSLEKNEWLQKPSKKNIQLHSKEDIKIFTANVMTMIDDLSEWFDTTNDTHQYEEISEEINDLLTILKELRKVQLKKSGEMSVGNIVYKALRREGYLDRLYDLKNTIYDKINSL